MSENRFALKCVLFALDRLVKICFIISLQLSALFVKECCVHCIDSAICVPKNKIYM